MPEEPRRIYWDANVFLSYLNAVPDRLPILDAILLSAERSKGQTEIVTSTISIAEVAYAAYERAQGALDPATEERIDGLWADTSVIKLADVSQLVVREARRIIREGIPQGWAGLRSVDAIHLPPSPLPYWGSGR